MFRPLPQSLSRASIALALSLAVSAPAWAAEKVVFAWTANPNTPQVDVALAKGYFSDAGLDVSLVSFPSGREGFEALLGGQVDIAFLAEFPAATGILRDQKFAVVGDLSRYRGSRIIGSTSAGPLDSPADLAGRKVGTTLGTNVNFYLSTVLDKAGVAVELVNAAPGDLVPALARGDVDAIVPFPTFYANARVTLGDRYAELRTDDYQPHYILAAKPELIEKRPEVLKAFLGALVRADADVAANRDEALDAVVKSLQGAVSRDDLAASWEDSEFGIRLGNDLLELLVEQGGWIVKQGVVKAEPPTEEKVSAFFHDAPLKEIASDRVDLR